MIIPLDKAVKFYELKGRLEALILAVINHDNRGLYEMSAEEMLQMLHDMAKELRKELRAIDATPDKGGAIREEGK